MNLLNSKKPANAMAYLPPPFRWNPWAVGALSALLLLGGAQLSPVVIDKKNFWSLPHIVLIGDPLIVIFMVAATYAFRGYQPGRVSSFIYTGRLLFFSMIGGAALLVNFHKEQYVNIFVGSFSSVFHSVFLVPLFAVHVVGVIPHLIFEVKGHRVARSIALTAISLYTLLLIFT